MNKDVSLELSVAWKSCSVVVDQARAIKADVSPDLPLASSVTKTNDKNSNLCCILAFWLRLVSWEQRIMMKTQSGSLKSYLSNKSNRWPLDSTLEIERRFCRFYPGKVVITTNRNVGRFVDGVKILASIGLLLCSESFSHNILYPNCTVPKENNSTVSTLSSFLNHGRCQEGYFPELPWFDP